MSWSDRRDLAVAGLGIVLSVLLWSSCSRQRDPILARVGSTTIRYSEVKRELLNSARLKPGQVPSDSLVRAELNRLIDLRLRYLEGLARGYDKDSTIATYLKNVRDDFAYRLYLDKHILEKEIPDRELWDYYKRYATRVKIRHILLRLPKDAPRDLVDEKRDRIEDIRTQILRGADFATMARKFSEEARTASNGGEWGYIRWGTGRFDDKFYQVAFSLKEGEVSKPFRTRVGWHLLKCEGISRPSKEEFELRKGRLRAELARRRQVHLDSVFYALQRKVMQRYNVHFHDDGFKRFVARVRAIAEDTTVKAPQLKTISVANQFRRIRPEDRSVVLVSWSGGKLTIGDVVDEINQMKEFKRPLLKSEGKLREWVGRKVGMKLMIQEAYREGFGKDKVVEREVNYRKERMIAAKVLRVDVTDPSRPTEDDLRRTYQADPERFREPPKARVQEIFIKKDKKLAEKVAKLAKSGADFEKLAKKYNQRSVTKSKNGWLGYISANMYGEVGRRALQMKPGEIAGPIAMGRGNFSIIRVVARKDSYVPPFDKARPRVRAYYIKHKREELRQAMLARLKKKFPVVVYDKNIALVCRKKGE